MKKLLLLISIVFVLSCSSNDSSTNESSEETPDNTPGSIVGKWKLTASSSGALSSCNLDNATYQFNSDLTAKETDGHFSGDTCIKSTYNETYSLSENILVINELRANGSIKEQYTFQVIQLTTKTLKIKILGNTLTYSRTN